MEDYTDNEQKTIANEEREARERRTRQKIRRQSYMVLDEIKTLELENILKRAPRSNKGKDGRTLRLGSNVAAMIRQLIFWEGRGAADGYWIWKSRQEWWDEAGLTYRVLRKARGVAEEEGLLEFEEHGSAGGSLVYYRLNMVQVLRVVASSELYNAREWLDAHPRSGKRSGRLKKARKWEGVLDDLRQWQIVAPAHNDGHDSGVAEGADPPDTKSGDPLHKVRPPIENYSKKESISNEIPKKDFSLMLSSKKPTIKPNLTDEEAERLWNDLLASDVPHIDHLESLADIMAEKNKNNEVSTKRVWKELGERYLSHREKKGHSDDAWEFGFERAISAEAPNIGYVEKVARNFKPGSPNANTKQQYGYRDQEEKGFK